MRCMFLSPLAMNLLTTLRIKACIPSRLTSAALRINSYDEYIGVITRKGSQRVFCASCFGNVQPLTSMLQTPSTGRRLSS
jgi:hypothetical protein